MKAPSFKPTLESLESRLTPGTFTLVNKSTSTVSLEIVRHLPADDGTVFNVGTSGIQSTGSFRIGPGQVMDFDSGDQGLLIRVQPVHGAPYRLSGPGISPLRGASVLGTLRTGYDIRNIDGADFTYLNVGGRVSQAPRSAPFNPSRFGLQHLSGFYEFPNDYTATIHGRRDLTITGSMSFPFSDIVGNTTYNYPVGHVFKAPHGAYITSFNPQVSSNFGRDNISFSLSSDRHTVFENGTISGSGLYSGGASYTGTLTINYAY